MTATLGNALDHWAKAAPDRTALAFAQDRVNYAQLAEWTDRIARRLVDDGAAPGDRIAIFAGNSANWCAAALGIIKAGCVLIPLNYRYAESELISIIENCTPTRLISDDPDGARMRALTSFNIRIMPMADIGALRRGAPVTFSREIDPKAPVVIAYTSGSTAQPKGVVFTHETMLARAFEASLSDPQWAPGKKALGPAPLYTGAGVITLSQFVVLGMQAFLTDAFDPVEALHTLIAEKIDNFGAVPIFFERITAVPAFASADLSHVQFASVSGARASRGLIELWAQRGVVLRHLYGLTEGGGSTTIADKETARAYPDMCGHDRAFTKHLIVDPTFKPCPPGVAGEIVLRGPTMMIGYWNNPAATQEAFVDGWLRTGDIGVRDEAGNIKMIDRLKDLIISGGLNIAPIDIENAIAELEGVEEVAVIAATDSRFGETPLAVIRARRSLEIPAIIAHCNQRLADYKVPRYIVLEDAPLPRLATGKIAKRVLKERYKNAAERLPRVR